MTKLELFLYIIGWTIETLIIKFIIGVSSWWIAIFLAITVGSLVLWIIGNTPEIIKDITD